MDHLSQEDREWIDHFLSRAETGDPDAQIAVAWEYVRGIKFEKNLDAAIDWFRKAEASAGELATFNLMKMCFIENDARISRVFSEKQEWHLGAIYLFYGLYLLRTGSEDEGIKNLETGKMKGSLASAIRLHQRRYRSPPLRLLAMPYEIFLAVKAGIIHMKDSRDPRILV